MAVRLRTTVLWSAVVWCAWALTMLPVGCKALDKSPIASPSPQASASQPGDGDRVTAEAPAVIRSDRSIQGQTVTVYQGVQWQERGCWLACAVLLYLSGRHRGGRHQQVKTAYDRLMAAR